MAPAKGPNARTPEDLVRAASTGEVDAFAELYRAYGGRIQAFAVARRSSDPEALTNDVFVRVFQNIQTFEGDEAAFLRWIFTIARNRLIDNHRKAMRRPIIAEAEVPVDSVPSAEHDAMEVLSLTEVAHRLSVLTDDQRDVIVLRLIEDLSHKDVAEIVGKPVTAVKALQRRALRRLQQEILGGEVS